MVYLLQLINPNWHIIIYCSAYFIPMTCFIQMSFFCFRIPSTCHITSRFLLAVKNAQILLVLDDLEVWR